VGTVDKISVFFIIIQELIEPSRGAIKTIQKMLLKNLSNHEKNFIKKNLSEFLSSKFSIFLFHFFFSGKESDPMTLPDEFAKKEFDKCV